MNLFFGKSGVGMMPEFVFNFQLQPRVEIDKIMTNLNSIFDTKFCSPGALGGMSLVCISAVS